MSGSSKRGRPYRRDPSFYDHPADEPARRRWLRGLGYGFLILCFCLSLPLLERDVLARFLGAVTPLGNAGHLGPLPIVPDGVLPGGGDGSLAPPPVAADVLGSATLDISAAPYGATELPPWIIPGGWRGYILSTGHSLYCPSPENLLTSPIRASRTDCALIVGRSTYAYDRDLYLPASQDYSGSLWKKNYYGSFSGHVTLRDTPMAKLISINHGENKNELIHGQRYQSEVNRDVDALSCASGYAGGAWEECWRAYNGFVGLSYAGFSAATQYGRQPMTDLGPIVWPSYGYLDAQGHKASFGVRHPSSLLRDGYLYVFYVDTVNTTTITDGVTCVRVARARIGADGLPQAFQTYYHGQFSQPALPAGFNPAHITAFLRARGPASDCAPDDTGPGTIRFSVAAIAGTDGLLAVEEFVDKQGWHLALRASKDLVHWSARTVVASAASWYAAPYRYPVFLSADGWSDYEIGAGGFYVLGTNGANAVSALHLAVR